MNIGTLSKRIIISLWIAFIVVCLGAYVYNPTWFTPSSIADFLGRYGDQIIILYFVISIIRGFSLLPSTPFVIAGTLLFQDQPALVFWISIIGITLSSTLIYYFSDYLGFSQFFEKKFPKQIQKLKDLLEKPYGVFFIIFWSFFPIVPTDLISYVAGSMKMNFWKFIIPLFIGESILVGSIVFLGSYFVKTLG